ncbi:class I SAM-dependent methyltransferase [Archangium gephyra]|uniref:hypothetical protein n=1 Tax=Archangium gephyra TaxID=48 RepID=UPI0035D4ED95
MAAGLPPSDYAEEAAEYVRRLRSAESGPLKEVLELGSGGGNNASHLKREFSLTLVGRNPSQHSTPAVPSFRLTA